MNALQQQIEFSDAHFAFFKGLTSISDELKIQQLMKQFILMESQLVMAAIEAKEKAEFLANHDALTGLPNRHYFMVQLETALQDVHTTHAVYMLDLDKFKPANDTYGHQFGDDILIEVSRRIRSCLSEKDIAARLGGDEFVILRRDTDDRDAVKVAANLVHELSQPYVIDGITAELSSSVGFALHTNARESARDLIRAADLALYTAKGNGGRNFQVFHRAINPFIKTRERK